MRDVLEDQGERTGQIWLEVAYGTSQVDKAKRGPGSFCIIPYEELHQIGLHKNTKFELLKTQLLPWAAEHFPNAPGKTSPIVGRLTNRQMVRLQEFQKRMAANIAALRAGENGEKTD